MSAAAVVIELPAGSEMATPVQELVRACSDHLRVPGGCVVASETEGGTSKATRAVAIVSWGPGQRSARVQVGLRGAERAEWPTAEMVFRAEDAPAERWKAVGLAIAALVGEDGGASDESAAPASPNRAPTPIASAPSSAGRDGVGTAPAAVPQGKAVPPPAPAPAAQVGSRESDNEAGGSLARAVSAPAGHGHPSHAWIDAAGVLASGTIWGGAIRGFYRVGETHWLGFASASYVAGTVATATPFVQLSRVEAATGGAFAHERGRVQVEGHAGLFVEWLHATGTDLVRGGQDTAGHTTGGLLLGGSAGFAIAPPLSAFAGGDLLGRMEGTAVRVGNLTVFHVPTLDWTAIVGLRLTVD